MFEYRTDDPCRDGDITGRRCNSIRAATYFQLWNSRRGTAEVSRHRGVDNGIIQVEEVRGRKV